MMLLFIGHLGNWLSASLARLGSFSKMTGEAFASSFRRPYRFGLLFQQMEFVGLQSVFIILLVSSFTGAVFTLQTVEGLRRFGGEEFVGGTVALSLARELGPVLTALMVTGRAASAMAAEIGTMRVTEQIDALHAMAINPVQYLVVPRVVASLLMVPILSALFLLVGLLGSYLIAIPILGVDPGNYFENIRWFLDPYDIHYGLIKGAVFGVLLALIGCHEGYRAHGGARGVGMATTRAVVIASVAIFMADYFLTELLFTEEARF